MNVITKEYYIAYFDILGYKSFFEDKDNDINEFLNYNIKLVKDIINKTTQNTMLFNYPFTLKMFSDNFVIMVENNQNIGEYRIVKVLSYLLAILQLHFLEKYKILIRGVVTKGEAYVNDQLIFGEGLIRAVDREAYANFPRIIIDKDRIQKSVCDDLCEYCIMIDEDEEYYINFFDILGMGIGNDEEFMENEEKHLSILKDNITMLVKKYGKYDRRVTDKSRLNIADKTISKYVWLLSKFNNYCQITYEEYKISYKLTLYYKLMKCEIEIADVE